MILESRVGAGAAMRLVDSVGIATVNQLRYIIVLTNNTSGAHIFFIN